MLGTMNYITLEGAKKMMAAAEAEALRNDWKVTIAIVDSGANLILFQRLDDVQAGSVDIAIGKARTAVNFKRPTKALEEMINGGRSAFLSVDGVLPLQGGLPVVVDGKVIGGVAASGMRADQDERVAQAAIDALLK